MNPLKINYFWQIVDQLPMEDFVRESMPQSLPILEAVYGKLFLNKYTNSSSNLMDKYSPENVVWQIVKFFASQDEGGGGGGSAGLHHMPPSPSPGGAPFTERDKKTEPKSSQRWEMCGPWVSTCKRLLSVLLSADPRVKRLVAERRKGLTKAIEGLGQHGLIGKCPDSVPRIAVLIFVAFAQ